MYLVFIEHRRREIGPRSSFTMNCQNERWIALTHAVNKTPGNRPNASKPNALIASNPRNPAAATIGEVSVGASKYISFTTRK